LQSLQHERRRGLHQQALRGRVLHAKVLLILVLEPRAQVCRIQPFFFLLFLALLLFSRLRDVDLPVAHAGARGDAHRHTSTGLNRSA
jgi:hypothetical protein